MEPVFLPHKEDTRLGNVLIHSIKATQWLGTLCTYVLLTFFYFTLLVPFGLAVRLLGDPLGLKPPMTRSFWVKRELGEPGLKDARKGY